SSTSAHTTFLAPAAASACASARPMPPAAPVTTAILSFTSIGQLPDDCNAARPDRPCTPGDRPGVQGPEATESQVSVFLKVCHLYFLDLAIFHHRHACVH